MFDKMDQGKTRFDNKSLRTDVYAKLGWDECNPFDKSTPTKVTRECDNNDAEPENTMLPVWPIVPSINQYTSYASEQIKLFNSDLPEESRQLLPNLLISSDSIVRFDVKAEGEGCNLYFGTVSDK